MSRLVELNLGFPEQEAQKAIGVLTKLIPHVTQENLVIVGGLARRHHLLRRGVEFPQRPFNDLDVMIKDPSELKPSVTDAFLLYHYHPPKNSSFFAGLVDPETKVKIDLFDYFHAPIDPEVVQIGGLTLQIRSAEDQLTYNVYDILKIFKGANISPKDFASVRQLLGMVDIEKTEKIWQMKYSSRFPFSLLEGIEKAEAEKEKFPERIFEHPTRRSRIYTCGECEETPGFPITPLEDVFNLLGFVN